MSSKRLIAIAISAIAVIGIGYVAITGNPQTEPAASGTVGAAQRYQAPQVGAGDVKVVDPEVQAFLQSETFDKITKDKTLQSVFSNPALVEILATPGVFQEMVKNPGVFEVLGKS